MAYIYLASPYTHKNEEVRQKRYEQAMEFAANSIRIFEIAVFSPIVYTHEMAFRYRFPIEESFWWPFNSAMLKEAEALWILPLDDWEKSAGIARERIIAEKEGIPVSFVTIP